jgi:hypothetical protein
MRAVLYKLDSADEWVKVDAEIHNSDDFVNFFVGFCGKHIYAEVYSVAEDDDPHLVEMVKTFFSQNYATPARDMIDAFYQTFRRVDEHSKNPLARR